jgi:hypothetical protein
MPTYSLIHPVVGAIAVLLCYATAYLGLSRMMLIAGKRSRFYWFRRNVHVNMGRSFVALLFVVYPLGILGISETGFSPFSTPHAYLGSFLLILFTFGAVLAFLILKGRWEYIKHHGRVMLAGAALSIFQIIGGIVNLRSLGIKTSELCFFTGR